MTVKFYQDNKITIYNGDCRQMSEIPDESVQCVVTSPPYWGLRKYEGSQELIWGDNHCEHQWGKLLPCHHPGQVTDAKAVHNETNLGQTAPSGQHCILCGAWKGAFGLEPTPELYVQHTIEILREIRRVLRKDGVCFFNIGDSYASGKGSCFNPGGGASSLGKVRKDAGVHPLHRGNVSDLHASGLKPKDLCLIPFHIAIATQQDGWWLRSVIIWNKPNPMPESVTDRPTNSYEFILMLTKSKKYYWDADAVREPHQYPPHSPGNRSGFESKVNGHRGEWGEFKEPDRIWAAEGGRNLRDVWTFPTVPYPEAHFAVFPEKLPDLCIKAATSEKGCCPKCGAPWARETANVGKVKQGWGIQTKIPPESGGHTGLRTKMINQFETLGWRPTCRCEQSESIPCTVLDPFCGTGTTLLVAKKLGRRAIGYDISAAYCQLSVDRNRQMALEIK